MKQGLIGEMTIFTTEVKLVLVNLKKTLTWKRFINLKIRLLTLDLHYQLGNITFHLETSLMLHQ